DILLQHRMLPCSWTEFLRGFFRLAQKGLYRTQCFLIAPNQQITHCCADFRMPNATESIASALTDVLCTLYLNEFTRAGRWWYWKRLLFQAFNMKLDGLLD